MSVVRNLALKISNAVVRYASPGCKEWAEGLAREAAFIEGDWAALGWALGSARVLFDYREAPIGSLAELPAVAEKFAQFANGQAVWVLSLTCFGWDITSALWFFRATNAWERVGCGLTELGYAVLGVILLIEWRRRRKLPPVNDVEAVIQFYKTELTRNLHSGRKSWIAISAVTFLFAGLMLARPVAWGTYASGLIWMGALLLLLQARRTNRRRLERLDALLAEQS